MTKYQKILTYSIALLPIIGVITYTMIGVLNKEEHTILTRGEKDPVYSNDTIIWKFETQSHVDSLGSSEKENTNDSTYWRQYVEENTLTFSQHREILQVKMIDGGLEKNINKFLKDKSPDDIIDIEMLSYGGAIIIYKDIINK